MRHRYLRIMTNNDTIQIFRCIFGERVYLKKLLLILTVFFTCFYFSGCMQEPQKSTESITISAAASLRDVLSEIQQGFEQEKGIKLTFNFGSSGALQKQIEEGAPSDVFISAGRKQMDALAGQSLVDKETVSSLLGNELVMVVPDEYKDKIKAVSDLVNLDVKISIGEPGSVPAGQYAKESLIYLDLWDKLKDKIVYAKDVKQVAAYVERGEAAAGVVYNSDAVVMKGSMVVQVFDENSHEPVAYPAAVVSESRNKEAAKAFLDYLKSGDAKQIFVNYGFKVDTK